MHDAEFLSLLARVRGIPCFVTGVLRRGEQVLGWVVREEMVRKSIQGEEILDKCHQSQQRLEERGWERIQTVSGIRKEGREVKITVQRHSIGRSINP